MKKFFICLFFSLILCVVLIGFAFLMDFLINHLYDIFNFIAKYWYVFFYIICFIMVYMSYDLFMEDLKK